MAYLIFIPIVLLCLLAAFLWFADSTEPQVAIRRALTEDLETGTDEGRDHHRVA